MIPLFSYELSPAKSVASANVICYSILEVIKNDFDTVPCQNVEYE
jgi:hypothetical protein